MESRKSEIEMDIMGLLARYIAVSKLDHDKDLEWDYGLTGDDAVEFLREYSKRFHVDVSKFYFHAYFHDEGENMKLLFRRLINRYSRQKITLKDLYEGTQTGVLLL